MLIFIGWNVIVSIFKFDQVVADVKRIARKPVVIVPGDGGSRLEARLNKPSVVNPFCYRKTDKYETLWLSVEIALPFFSDCLVDNMKLVHCESLRCNVAC
ncbi:unnamed protein product [Soboliphyme baturini]|uniref:Alpha/beta hydrolase n=1 Tax=Soboliphyme baturini TaxID=241478 RepID=A0A183IPI1_9BILA|nr:unnamed protein product [Soboliphyme baturini]